MFVKISAGFALTRDEFYRCLELNSKDEEGVENQLFEWFQTGPLERIDLLQLLATLTFLSGAPLSRKVRFLFDLVDLNHEDEISSDELGLLIRSLCTGLYKLNILDEISNLQVHSAATVAFRQRSKEEWTSKMTFPQFEHWFRTHSDPAILLDRINLVYRLQYVVKSINSILDRRRRAFFENYDEFLWNTLTDPVYEQQHQHIHVTVNPIVGQVSSTSARILLEIDTNATVQCFAISKMAPEILTLEMKRLEPMVFYFESLLPDTRYNFGFTGICKADQERCVGTFQTPQDTASVGISLRVLNHSTGIEPFDPRVLQDKDPYQIYSEFNQDQEGYCVCVHYNLIEIPDEIIAQVEKIMKSNPQVALDVVKDVLRSQLNHKNRILCQDSNLIVQEPMAEVLNTAWSMYVSVLWPEMQSMAHLGLVSIEDEIPDGTFDTLVVLSPEPVITIENIDALPPLLEWKSFDSRRRVFIISESNAENQFLQALVERTTHQRLYELSVANLVLYNDSESSEALPNKIKSYRIQQQATCQYPSFGVLNAQSSVLEGFFIPTRPARPVPRMIFGPIVHEITHDTARLVVEFDIVGEITCRVLDLKTNQEILSQHLIPKAKTPFLVELKDLKPGRDYSFELQAADPPFKGTIQTPYVTSPVVHFHLLAREYPDGLMMDVHNLDTDLVLHLGGQVDMTLAYQQASLRFSSFEAQFGHNWTAQQLEIVENALYQVFADTYRSQWMLPPFRQLFSRKSHLFFPSQEDLTGKLSPWIENNPQAKWLDPIITRVANKAYLAYQGNGENRYKLVTYQDNVAFLSLDIFDGNPITSEQWDFFQKAITCIQCPCLVIISPNSPLLYYCQTSKNRLDQWESYPETLVRLLTLLFTWKYNNKSKQLLIVAGGVPVGFQSTIKDLRLNLQIQQLSLGGSNLSSSIALTTPEPFIFQNRFEFTPVTLLQQDDGPEYAVVAAIPSRIMSDFQCNLLSQKTLAGNITVGPIIGRITTTEARIMLECSEAIECTCILDSPSHRNVARTVAMRSGRPEMFVFQDLLPDTTYQVSVQGPLNAASVSGRVKTQPERKLETNIVFVCDNYLEGFKDQAEGVWQEILHQQPSRRVVLRAQHEDRYGNPLLKTNPWENLRQSFNFPKPQLDLLCHLGGREESYQTVWNIPPINNVLQSCSNLMLDREFQEIFADPFLKIGNCAVLTFEMFDMVNDVSSLIVIMSSTPEMDQIQQLTEWKVAERDRNVFLISKNQNSFFHFQILDTLLNTTIEWLSLGSIAVPQIVQTLDEIESNDRFTFTKVSLGKKDSILRRGFLSLKISHEPQTESISSLYHFQPPMIDPVIQPILGPILGRVVSKEAQPAVNLISTAIIWLSVHVECTLTCVVIDVMLNQRHECIRSMSPSVLTSFYFENLVPERRYRYEFPQMSDEIAATFTTPSVNAEETRILFVQNDNPFELPLDSEINPWQSVYEQVETPWHGIDLIVHLGKQIPLQKVYRECLEWLRNLQLDEPNDEIRSILAQRIRSMYNQCWNMPHTRKVFSCTPQVFVWSFEEIVQEEMEEEEEEDWTRVVVESIGKKVYREYEERLWDEMAMTKVEMEMELNDRDLNRFHVIMNGEICHLFPTRRIDEDMREWKAIETALKKEKIRKVIVSSQNPILQESNFLKLLIRWKERGKGRQVICVSTDKVIFSDSSIATFQIGSITAQDEAFGNGFGRIDVSLDEIQSDWITSS